MSAPAPAPSAAAQRIARSSALLGGGVAAAQALSFATGLLVTQQLGADYGAFLGAQRFASLFRTVADLGLGVVVVRAVAAARPDAGAVYGTALGLRCASALVFGAVVLLAARAVDYLPAQLPVLWAFIALQAFESLGETGNAVLEGRERMGRAALVQVIRAGALLAAVLTAVQGAAGVRGFSAVYAGCAALQCACATLFALSLRPRLRVRLEPARAPALLREGSLYVLIAGAYALMRSLDVVLLTRFAGAAESARYGAALNLVEAGLILPALLQRALLPVFSRADGAAHEPICSDTLRLASALFVPFAAGLALLAPEAIALYGSTAFDGAEAALRGLAGLVPLSAASTIAGAYLTGVGRAGALLGVYALVLPPFALFCAGALATGAGAGAMAIAALLGQALLSAGVLRLAGRRGVSLPWSACALHLALCAVMALAVLALRGRAPLLLTVLVGALVYGGGLYWASAPASPERRVLAWLWERAARRT